MKKGSTSEQKQKTVKYHMNIINMTESISTRQLHRKMTLNEKNNGKFKYFFDLNKKLKISALK